MRIENNIYFLISRRGRAAAASPAEEAQEHQAPGEEAQLRGTGHTRVSFNSRVSHELEAPLKTPIYPKGGFKVL